MKGFSSTLMLELNEIVNLETIKGLALTLLLKILRWLDVWGQPVIVELESWQQAIHKIEV